jgi:chromosome segregation ATPase
MEWLQHHMRKHLAEAEGATNIISLAPRLTATEELGAKALKLVQRAIEHIRHAEQDAVEKDARADMLARNAIEQLNTMQERARCSELACRAAEAQVERTSVKLQHMEMELERAAAELAAAQTKIRATENRARDAEKRATEAENALKRIETMINALLFDKRLSTGDIAA